MIKDSAKTILCYGDSNTWGADASTDGRHPRSIRWPAVLQDILGDDYEVIAEGLPGRTFLAVESGKLHRTGITHLRALLESHEPIDLVIIMLGTNDIKTTFNLTPEEITSHLEQTILCIQNETDLEDIPKILVVCPPPVLEPSEGELDSRMVNGPVLSKKLPPLFKAVAEKHNSGFIDAGEHTSFGKVDGYHFDAGGHKKLAEVLYTWIQKQ